MQSHPLRRTRFGQYQASSAALGWPGDGDCYLMHRMQSGAGLIQKSVETPRKHRLFVQLFFVQLSFVRRSYVAIDRHARVIDACVRARAYRGTGGTGSIVNKAQGKQCKANSACLKAVCA